MSTKKETAVDYTSSLLGFKVSEGVQPTLEKRYTSTYQTGYGQNLYQRNLVGIKNVLFPTCTSDNCCFEYRFTFRNMVMPSDLPEVTDLYIKSFGVKIQDLFTQVMSNTMINQDGQYTTYMPYCAIVCQDENGIEYEEHEVMVNGKAVTQKFVNSNRLVQRDSNVIYAVNSNLKYENSISFETNSNSYKLLGVYYEYDENGTFIRRTMKAVKSITPENIREIQENMCTDEEYRKGKEVMYDLILCDLLIFCVKTVDVTKTDITTLTRADVENQVIKNSIPISWLTPVEKLEKYGKKGQFKGTYNIGQFPKSLYLYVDMQETSERITNISKMTSPVFTDENGIISPCKNQYTMVAEISEAKVFSDR